MMEALIVSNLLLWIAVCTLGLVVFALTRQIGLLHERIAPAGALAVEVGPAVGEMAGEFALESLDHSMTRVGGPSAEQEKTLLFFLSPTCPICATLLPTLRRLIEEENGATRLLFASDGPRAQHEAFSKDKGLDPSQYVLSRELGLHFEVSKLPYAVLIDAMGTIRAKGLVNTREHLESLFEAERMGVASLQQYLMTAADSDDGDGELDHSAQGATR